jgi:hypothetical protein
MAELPVPTDFQRTRTPFNGRDDWAYRMTWQERTELEVVLSDTQRCVAGLTEPTVQWIFDRAREQTIGRLRNDLPLMAQIRSWPQPLVLHAPPR